MFKRVRSNLHELRANASGNATMIVALSLPVLLGAAGYATETAEVYAWKRELQHAVDQGAIAGAWALSYDKTTTTYSTRAQQEYDANKGMIASFADADATVQLGTYGSTTNNSVIVTASASKRLPFSGYLLNTVMTVSAKAQATFTTGGSYKACLMAIKQDGNPTFTVGGSAVVNASCGLGALSCDDGAVDISVDSTDPTKKGVTTNSIITCGAATVPDYLKSKVTQVAEGVLSNPFADLPAPVPTSSASKTLTCPNGNSSTTINVVPGVYKSFSATCKIVMTKGIYVIDGGVLDLSSQKANVTGNGVMFVLKNGATINMSGQGNAGTINLTPMEAADFVGTANEDYKDLYGDMLIYQDDTGQTTATSNSIRGNSTINMRGTIYLPAGNLTINGNSTTTTAQCLQLWASTLTITGNASLTTNCTSTQTNSAGSSAGGVRLVV